MTTVYYFVSSNVVWLVVYLSEKWWSSSVGMMIIPNLWKVIKFRGSKPPTSGFFAARPAQLLGKSPRKSGILGRKAPPETPKIHERNGGFWYLGMGYHSGQQTPITWISMCVFSCPEDLNLQIAPNRKSMHYSYTFPLTPQIIYLSDFNWCSAH